ncbi:hypothetical protein PARPLA_00484 [Rhodobacteraceae bacterium THAF1]|nr:hypothetical protein FIU81_14840 [Palleronia sp. THAF1]VDC17143.1 hypothetical protein PARPLA_00484 [Rhodobacteraceae bacterium THAF1]
MSELMLKAAKRRQIALKGIKQIEENVFVVAAE